MHAFFTKENMRKIVNVRLAVIAALGCGLGAALGFACVYYGITYLWMIAVVPVTAALLIFFIVKGWVKYIVLTAITAVLFVAGFFGVVYKTEKYNDKQLTDSSYYFIVGTVSEKGYTDDGEYIKLKNVTADGYSVEGKIYVYLDYNYGEYCEVGYRVSFTGAIYCNEAFAYGVISSTRLIEDIRYTAYVSGDVSSEYEFSLFGSVNIKIRQLLFDCADRDVASVAYGMLTGNTEYVETSTIESFQYGGIAHVFAVSGLHIGLVYAVVSFLLKRFHAGQPLSAVICIIIMFIYAGICGFTISSIRAAIMCTVMLAVTLSGGKYDALSSVSIAFIIILLVNPLNIVSSGFQLSIAATAGIAMFSHAIQSMLQKIKIPEKISSSVSVAISAQLATFPVLLSSFGYVSWASLLLNIIFIPLISVIFMVLFVCMLLALIIQPLAVFLVSFSTAPLAFVMSLLVSIKAEKALISGFEFGVLVPLYYAVIFLLSDKFNITKKVRAIVVPIGAAIVTAAILIMNYVPAGKLSVTATAWYGDSSAVLLKTSDANVLVICQTPSSYDISTMLRENGVKVVDAIIILGDDESLLAYTQCGETCQEVYVYYMNIDIQPFTGTTVKYLRTFIIDGVTYTFIDYGNIIAEYGGVTVGINMYDDVAFERCNLLIAETSTDSCETLKTIYFRQQNGYDNIYDCGDLQFTIKNGKLYS